jgi:glutathione synthase/RimK-type ligase-like ATP-grasp enzyme
MQVAWSDVETLLSTSPHNKVLATQLSLSQRARGMQADDPEQWRLFAASTLLSGMIVKPPHSSDDT